MIRACLAVLIFYQAVLSGTQHEPLARAGTLQLSPVWVTLQGVPTGPQAVVSAPWAGPFQVGPLWPSFPC